MLTLPVKERVSPAKPIFGGLRHTKLLPEERVVDEVLEKLRLEERLVEEAIEEALLLVDVVVVVVEVEVMLDPSLDPLTLDVLFKSPPGIIPRAVKDVWDCVAVAASAAASRSTRSRAGNVAAWWRRYPE